MKFCNLRKKIKISQKNIMYICLIIIFIIMLILNFVTPLIADDYSYSFALDKTRVTNLFQIFEMQYNHYFTWGGRIIAHTIAQFFLMFPKNVFNFFNAAVFTFIVFLINKHSKIAKDNPLNILIIFFLIWFVVPVFGENCIWLVGSCNYLWTLMFMLLFLIPYNTDFLRKDSLLFIIEMFLFGIIAGWGNENTSFGVIIIAFLFTIKNWKTFHKIKKWEISGILGNIIGFSFMILAPGNFVRSNSIVDNTFILIKILKRIRNATQILCTTFLPLIIILIILLGILIYNKKKINTNIYIFLIASFLSIYAMCLSPQTPLRVWFGPIIFAIIAIMIAYNEVIKICNLYKFIPKCILIGLTFIFINQYLSTEMNLNDLKRHWEERIAIMENLKNEGIYEVEFDIISSKNSHNPVYKITDLGTEPNVWPNNDIERYYGMQKITGNILGAK